MDFQDLGIYGVMLSSCIIQCDYPYYSNPKTFLLFNQHVCEIQIIKGIGHFNPFTNKILTDNDDNDTFDNIFEINDEVFDIQIDPEISTKALEIFRHIRKCVSILFGTSVVSLNIGFGIKQIDGDYKIYIIDSLCCKIRKSEVCDMLYYVPDGSLLTAQLIVFFTSYVYPTDRCFGSLICMKEPKTTVVAGVVIKQKISELFFDCDIRHLFQYVRCLIEDINISSLRNPVSFCSSCYFEWQKAESRRMKESMQNSYTIKPNNSKKTLPPVKIRKKKNLGSLFDLYMSKKRKSIRNKLSLLHSGVLHPRKCG